MRKIVNIIAWAISIYGLLTFWATAVWYIKMFIVKKPFSHIEILVVLMITHALVVMVLPRIERFDDKPFWEPVLPATRKAKKKWRWIFVLSIINSIIAISLLFLTRDGDPNLLISRMLMSVLMVGSVYTYSWFALGHDVVKLWVPLTSEWDELDFEEKSKKGKS